ncbi:MAG: winged helix-turn-helix domain-containing protein [Candidatus Jordarchaeum sp.]|uniref:winged helix-turn-helix domain-containing protein n=1 Tax=Candidatus Jordarchaeum sp. TaxID=2823881 RepID=UPI00404A3156
MSKLFGSVSRARILELLFSNVEKSFYQREIMFEAGLNLQPTQRELNNLVDLGIIKARETRDKVYYEVDKNSPLFHPLSEIIRVVKKSGSIFKASGE